MSEIESQAHELVRRGEYLRAVELYDQLLTSGQLVVNKQISKERVVACLLGRSECCLELGRHETVVSDCRRIIKILAGGNENNTGARARRRLVHALFNLRRFSEAEMATREWLALNGGVQNNPEALKMLENLRSVLQKNAPPKEDELLSLERRFETFNLLHQQICCTYCSLTFRDRNELRQHCQTEAHQTMIMSDEGRDWKWRAPPRGYTADVYSACESWTENGMCRYGAQCVEAHGPEELAEWKERFEYRRMKLQRACEKELYGKSYTEVLLEKWLQARSPECVMKEKLDFVEDGCTDELVTTMSSKHSKRDWSFILKTTKNLNAIALLQDAHRNHFILKQIIVRNHSVQLTNDQEWLSNSGIEEHGEVLEYKVTVSFETDIYGTFRQSIVFDFGSEPVLVKHLCVDCLPVTDADKLKEIKKEIIVSSAERWDNDNANIIAFSSPVQPLIATPGNKDSDWEKELLNAYPCPKAESFTLTHSTVAEKRLTRNNYRARMHELLCVEEMARYEQVARYNLTAKLQITYSYLLAPNGIATSTAKYSHSGELFALMTLGKDISEDTSAGRLILNNCTTVLIAAADEKTLAIGLENEADKPKSKRKVYEALIEDKGKNMIYLRLPAVCVSDLILKPDTELNAQVQFQLNRIPYCEWHYAIDKIADFRIIFPDTYLEPNIPWTPQRQWADILDVRLNLKQKEAVVAITTPTTCPLPPILIIGPFGTGKTYTLAQAIKQLLLQSNTRILICTHSNSAADLYIKDYLHPYVEAGHEEARPLRIYYHKRWVATVHQTVQKYCLIENNGGVRNFRVPTLEDIMKHRIIVVTLSISMYLSTMGLNKGHFTHILLDEAAQAMECEAIMPLALADQNTRIVLAGDHMQLSPELFSQFAKERNLHVSLLERLYDHYPSTFPCKILLCENYRAHEAIIHFTSELFYDQKLISSGKQPRHDKFYPLTFFTTRGEDVQDQNSTAFYNNSEVYEVVERVCELKKKWPPAWGKMDDQSIGIMTPYADQVFRIRSELRKRRMGGISVERVLNVQGKQFRAIFLSTVRTRRTCTSSQLKSNNDDIDYGFLSNSKLLNTAITRAQSLVAVVGDPVALCSIGRCRKVWERFIEICNQNKSLFGITWTLLRSQLDGVELKKTYVLNPLAPEFIPRQFQTESYIKIPLPVAIPPPQSHLFYHHNNHLPISQQQATVNPNLPIAINQIRLQPQQQQSPTAVIIQSQAQPQPPPAPPPQPPAPAAPVFPLATQMYFIPAAGQPHHHFIPNQAPPQIFPPIRAPPPQAFNVNPPWPPATNMNYPLASPSSGENATNGPAWPPKIPIKKPMDMHNLLQQQSPSNGGPVVRMQQSQQLIDSIVSGEVALPPQFMSLQPKVNVENGGRLNSVTDKEQIQFLHNVHFPERQQQIEAANVPNLLPHMPHFDWGTLTHLLPANVSPAEMLMAPQAQQLQWYRHLHERFGMEAANKFRELLIKLKQQNERNNTVLPPQAAQVASSEDEIFSENLHLLANQNLVLSAQQQPNLLPSINSTELLNWQQQQQLNKTINKPPIYLRDAIEAPILLANLQQQQQNNGHDPFLINQQQQQQQSQQLIDCRVPWQNNQAQQQSVPLYRRQGPQPQQSMINNANSNNNLDSGLDKAATVSSSAFSGYARAAISIREQQQPPNQLQQMQNWQRQINAEFAAMKQCGDEQQTMIDDLLLNRHHNNVATNTTYASVLRTNKQYDEPATANIMAEKIGDPFAVLRDLGQRSVSQTGHGLYQYFS